MTVHQQVQQLISKGQTKGALVLLVTHDSDAILLQSRYEQALKQQNMGMLDFGEWSRVQNQVNYAALEMASNVRVNVNITSNVVIFISDDEFNSKPLKGKIRLLFERLVDSIEDEDITLAKLQRVVELLHRNFTSELTQTLEDELANFSLPKFERKPEIEQQFALAEFAQSLLYLKPEIEAAAAEKKTIEAVKTATQLWVEFQVEPLKSNWDMLVEQIRAELRTARNRHLSKAFEDHKRDMDAFVNESQMTWKLKTASTRRGIQLQIIEKII